MKEGQKKAADLVWDRQPDMRLFFGLIVVIFATNSYGEEPAKKGHRIEHSVMHQQQVVIPDGSPIPQLAMVLNRDQEDGFNLHVELTNFQMESPASKAESSGNIVRGHAHLYLNGVKLTRLYAKDIHLPARLFRSGMNSLQISINDHDHAVWAIGNDPIQATILLNPGLEQFQLSHYSSSPISDKQ